MTSPFDKILITRSPSITCFSIHNTEDNGINNEYDIVKATTLNDCSDSAKKE